MDRAPHFRDLPDCIAVEAASEQGWEAGYRYLRRVREGLLCFRRKLDEPAALIAEAGPAGLDVAAFEDSFASTGPTEAFERHMAEVREVPEEARALGKTSVTDGHERLSFPSAIFIAEDGERHGVYGFQPAEAYREAALAAGARQVNEGPLPILDAAARFGRLAEPEVEALCGTESIETRAELWRLAREGRLKPVGALTGTLWELV